MRGIRFRFLLTPNFQRAFAFAFLTCATDFLTELEKRNFELYGVTLLRFLSFAFSQGPTSTGSPPDRASSNSTQIEQTQRDTTFVPSTYVVPPTPAPKECLQKHTQAGGDPPRLKGYESSHGIKLANLLNWDAGIPLAIPTMIFSQFAKRLFLHFIVS